MLTHAAAHRSAMQCLFIATSATVSKCGSQPNLLLTPATKAVVVDEEPRRQLSSQVQAELSLQSGLCSCHFEAISFEGASPHPFSHGKPSTASTAAAALPACLAACKSGGCAGCLMCPEELPCDVVQAAVELHRFLRVIEDVTKYPDVVPRNALLASATSSSDSAPSASSASVAPAVGGGSRTAGTGPSKSTTISRGGSGLKLVRDIPSCGSLQEVVTGEFASDVQWLLVIEEAVETATTLRNYWRQMGVAVVRCTPPAAASASGPVRSLLTGSVASSSAKAGGWGGDEGGRRTSAAATEDIFSLAGVKVIDDATPLEADAPLLRVSEAAPADFSFDLAMSGGGSTRSVAAGAAAAERAAGFPQTSDMASNANMAMIDAMRSSSRGGLFVGGSPTTKAASQLASTRQYLPVSSAFQRPMPPVAAGFLKRLWESLTISSSPCLDLRPGDRLASFTSLHQSCLMDAPLTAFLLVAMGADAHALDDVGRTPLHLAVESGCMACAQIIVEGAHRKYDVLRFVLSRTDLFPPVATNRVDDREIAIERWRESCLASVDMIRPVALLCRAASDSRHGALVASRVALANDAAALPATFLTTPVGRAVALRKWPMLEWLLWTSIAYTSRCSSLLAQASVGAAEQARQALLEADTAAVTSGAAFLRSYDSAKAKVTSPALSAARRESLVTASLCTATWYRCQAEDTLEGALSERSDLEEENEEGGGGNRRSAVAVDQGNSSSTNVTSFLEVCLRRLIFPPELRTYFRRMYPADSLVDGGEANLLAIALRPDLRIYCLRRTRVGTRRDSLLMHAVVACNVAFDELKRRGVSIVSGEQRDAGTLTGHRLNVETDLEAAAWHRANQPLASSLRLLDWLLELVSRDRRALYGGKSGCDPAQPGEGLAATAQRPTPSSSRDTRTTLKAATDRLTIHRRERSCHPLLQQNVEGSTVFHVAAAHAFSATHVLPRLYACAANAAATSATTPFDAVASLRDDCGRTFVMSLLRNHHLVAAANSSHSNHDWRRSPVRASSSPSDRSPPPSRSRSPAQQPPTAGRGSPPLINGMTPRGGGEPPQPYRHSAATSSSVFQSTFDDAMQRLRAFSAAGRQHLTTGASIGASSAASSSLTAAAASLPSSPLPPSPQSPPPPLFVRVLPDGRLLAVLTDGGTTDPLPPASHDRASQRSPPTHAVGGGRSPDCAASSSSASWLFSPACLSLQDIEGNAGLHLLALRGSHTWLRAALSECSHLPEKAMTALATMRNADGDTPLASCIRIQFVPGIHLVLNSHPVFARASIEARVSLDRTPLLFAVHVTISRRFLERDVDNQRMDVENERPHCDARLRRNVIRALLAMDDEGAALSAALQQHGRGHGDDHTRQQLPPLPSSPGQETTAANSHSAGLRATLPRGEAQSLFNAVSGPFLETPLLAAVRHGPSAWHVASLLLSFGARPDIADVTGATCLDLAVRRQDDDSLVTLLLANDTEPMRNSWCRLRTIITGGGAASRNPAIIGDVLQRADIDMFSLVSTKRVSWFPFAVDRHGNLSAASSSSRRSYGGSPPSPYVPIGGGGGASSSSFSGSAVQAAAAKLTCWIGDELVCAAAAAGNVPLLIDLIRRGGARSQEATNENRSPLTLLLKCCCFGIDGRSRPPMMVEPTANNTIMTHDASSSSVFSSSAYARAVTVGGATNPTSISNTTTNMNASTSNNKLSGRFSSSSSSDQKLAASIRSRNGSILLTHGGAAALSQPQRAAPWRQHDVRPYDSKALLHTAVTLMVQCGFGICKSALVYALMADLPDVAQLLWTSSPFRMDMTLRCGMTGKTAIHVACERVVWRNEDPQRFFKPFMTFRGADPTIRDHSGMDILRFGAMHQQPLLVAAALMTGKYAIAPSQELPFAPYDVTCRQPSMSINTGGVSNATATTTTTLHRSNDSSLNSLTGGGGTRTTDRNTLAEVLRESWSGGSSPAPEKLAVSSSDHLTAAWHGERRRLIAKMYSYRILKSLWMCIPPHPSRGQRTANGCQRPSAPRRGGAAQQQRQDHAPATWRRGRQVARHGERHATVTPPPPDTRTPSAPSLTSQRRSQSVPSPLPTSTATDKTLAGVAQTQYGSLRGQS